ncbi:hypothetical protein ACNQ62_05430 [Sulfitobacter sp. SBS6]|uniref:hypothetical protein n=1 Tax=Sulfitobacter sp. SBS6 TaxID=3401755 RepID=UPI003AAC4703
MLAYIKDHHDIIEALTVLAASTSSRSLTSGAGLDRYLAASLLQKAIRRGEPEFAWRAASYLVENYREYFWRRLPIIALEDIGLANLKLVELVLATSSDTSVRAKCGGCIRVASLLIDHMCESIKDRSSDDLYDVLTRDHAVEEHRARLLECNPDVLFNPFEWGEGGVVKTANKLAALAGCGAEVPAMGLNRRRWKSAIEALDETFVSPVVREVALLGVDVTGCVLAPMMLAASGRSQITGATIDDPTLEPTSMADVPLWALGLHTRVGLDGFRRFIAQSRKMKAILRESATGDVSPAKMVGGLVFRLDCGQLKRRLDWQTGNELKSRATNLGWGVRDEAVPEALAILRNEYDLLSECRAAALRDYLK